MELLSPLVIWFYIIGFIFSLGLFYINQQATAEPVSLRIALVFSAFSWYSVVFIMVTGLYTFRHHKHYKFLNQKIW